MSGAARERFVRRHNLRTRMGEIPKDKEIISFCKVSLRGYAAALILKTAGYEDVKVLDGGVAMWLYEEGACFNVPVEKERAG